MTVFPPSSLPRVLRHGLTVICLATLCATARATPDASHWVASWAAAPQSVSPHPAAPSYDRAPAIDRQTVRQIIYSRVAGKQVRIRISNRYGHEPLVIARTHIARALAKAGIDPASDTPVTFHGKAEAVIPAGGELRSDPVRFKAKAGDAMAVSFYVDRAVAPRTWHKLASQVNYLSSPGDYTADPGGKAFPGRLTSFLWLAGLDVDTGTRAAFSAVAIGDSVTDGMRSTLNANMRWPDVLAGRLTGTPASVVNLGIAGNRLLSDSPCYGERLVSRFNADALEQPAVRVAIVLIGINDINFAAMPPHAGLDCDAPHTRVDAAAMIAGFQGLIAAAHAHQVRIIGGTITPASLPPAREAIRIAVNHWIRSSGKFDEVADFDAALRDPRQPSRLLARFDSGDQVHPSDAGYAEMGRLIPLAQLGVTQSASAWHRH